MCVPLSFLYENYFLQGRECICNDPSPWVPDPVAILQTIVQHAQLALTEYSFSTQIARKSTKHTQRDKTFPFSRGHYRKSLTKDVSLAMEPITELHQLPHINSNMKQLYPSIISLLSPFPFSTLHPTDDSLCFASTHQTYYPHLLDFLWIC